MKNMKHIKLFKNYESIKFKRDKPFGWRNWTSARGDHHEVKSLFPDSIFLDIEDIISPIVDLMETKIIYDVLGDSKNHILVINITALTKSGFRNTKKQQETPTINNSELMPILHHLRDYIGERGFKNNEIKISLSDGTYHHSKGGDIDDLLELMGDNESDVDILTIEFIKIIKVL
jgi:hypothetical protein